MKRDSPFKIFIVEDDEWYCEFLTYHLSQNPEYEIEKFHTGKELLENIYKKPSLITLDYSLPDLNGDAVLKKIKDIDQDIPVVIISGQEDVSTAVNLLKVGAYDYIIKDDETKDRLWNSAKHVRENQKLRNEVITLKEQIVTKYTTSTTIKGNSASIKKIFALIEKASTSNITISITGETGTGKELVAKEIHYKSERNKKSFVAVNVAAIPRELVESELFGYEKGAFTGANSRKIGKFEEADGGTLFLDEIGEMDLNIQAKILRVLQEREVTRVGGNKETKINIRLIVATHRDLAIEVEKGNFREDLYFRILGMPINLPPLRDRGSDVIILAKHFIEVFCKENNLNKLTLSPDAQNKLLGHAFPGNIRELKAIIELACVMSDGGTIEEEHVRFNSLPQKNGITKISTNLEGKSLREYTDDIIRTYLERYDDNVILVSKKLKVGKSTIYRMLKSQEGLNNSNKGVESELENSKKEVED